MQPQLTTQEDHEKIVANHKNDTLRLNKQKQMMIKQIDGMDINRDRERIIWFWNALCNGYFDMENKK